MTDTSHPWPESTHETFDFAIMSDTYDHDKFHFYGPFTRLLYALFSIDGPYEVMLQFKYEAL